jgi:hypothetical protein
MIHANVKARAKTDEEVGNSRRPLKKSRRSTSSTNELFLVTDSAVLLFDVDRQECLSYGVAAVREDWRVAD